ncbi:MAG: multidrug efflux pump subunit AcrA (membrane-fusion protein) [Pirellulaceae bacterium]
MNSKFCGSLLVVVFCCAEGIAQEVIPIESAVLKIIETVNISTESKGVIDSVPVKEGTLVAKGDVLTEIRNTGLILKLEQSRSQREIAEAEATNDVNIRFARKSLAVSASELDRAEQANFAFPRTVPELEIERLRLVVDRKKLEIEQAEHVTMVARLQVGLHENQVKVDEDAVNRLKVRAPKAGMVVAVERHEGEWVEPGTVVARLIRIDLLRVEGFVTAQQAALGLVGRKVQVTVDLPHSDYLGTIVFVHPDANPVNGKVRVWAEIENTRQQLVPGLRAKAVIQAP